MSYCLLINCWFENQQANMHNLEPKIPVKELNIFRIKVYCHITRKCNLEKRKALRVESFLLKMCFFYIF